MADAFIISGARTPIGSLLGNFKSFSASDLGGVAIQAAMARGSIDAAQVEEVIMGNVLQAGVGQAPARQAALKAGLPNSIAAVTVNKVCGSGLKAVMMAGQAIRCGDAEIIVAGGMENMTMAPHLVPAMRGGVKLGESAMLDAMVHDGLTCAFNSCHMGMHAEHIADKFQVTREEQDAFALQSQQRAAAALEQNLFAEEIAPVTLRSRKGETVVERDESPRPDTTLEGLQKLRTVFKSDGSVTPGNASTINDGAAAVVVCGESTAAKSDFKLRIVASHTSGTDPQDLFIAPVTAIQGVLQKAGLQLDDIDLFEINEAFASQMLACMKELQLDAERVNIHGGGISLGHPIGASGARVLVTLMHSMKRLGKNGAWPACAWVVEMPSR